MRGEETRERKKSIPPHIGRDFIKSDPIRNHDNTIFHSKVKRLRRNTQPLHAFQHKKTGGRYNIKTDIRNEIKAQIIRSGFTMQELVDRLHDGAPAQSEIARGEEEQRNERALALARERVIWSLRRRSDSVSNLSAKLKREFIRYREVVELADVLGYEIIWQKQRDAR